MRTILAALMLALAAPAQAETLDGARIIVIDGDTIALPCARPAPGCAERVRLYAIDAPELRGARCEAESVLALAAKERLRALMSGRVEIVRGEPGTHRIRDGFGRTLGTVIRIGAAPGLPAGDVQDDLLKRGLALIYKPGAAAKEARRAFWCGGK